MIMNNQNLSNQAMVGVIAAFKMSNGRISYKGCEFSKDDFHRTFLDPAHQHVSQAEMLGKLVSISEEFLQDWNAMDLETANLLADVVLHSDSAADYMQNPNLENIGFEILINPYSTQPIAVTYHDAADWYRVKSNIINNCEGEFTETDLTIKN